MAEQQQIESAMSIYYYLLKEGELSLDKNKDLYLHYSDDEIRAIVETLARESDVIIEKYNQVIYFIPTEENNVLGFKETELQKIVSSSNEREREAGYLSQYIITLIITLFFSGQGNKIKSRDFMRISEIVDEITKRLEFASSKEDIAKLQEDAKFNILSIYRHWDSLPIDNSNPRVRLTKFGYVKSVCSFLDKQRLLQYDVLEEDIRPTHRLTHLMSYSFLNKNRLEIINQLFEREGEVVAENQ